MRVASATLVAVALAGLVVVGPLPAQPAQAALTSDSALTVEWLDDSSSAAKFQPERDEDSPHFGDFDGLAVTVSQTKGIIDQAIRVTVTGFTATQSSFQTGLEADNAKNYVQAMQCWGDDPLADDFNETCQWGGRYRAENSGLGSSVIPDNAARTGPLDFDLANPTTHDVPFRTPGGTTVSGKLELDKDGNAKYPILDFFGPSTTNEVTSARIGSGGTGYFDFETQSADQAPQLGCGTAAHLRCWLVVVPRGTHFGGDGVECSGILDQFNDYEPYTYGRSNSVQGGSPVNDLCDYWDNRVVVPLDFTPTGTTCPIGSTETRVIGSQLMIGAMSSWQPSLCQSIGNTFSFASNPDSVARAQLIDTGANSPRIAYSGYPVSSGELLTDYERDQLVETDLTYAPVAISGAVVAFLAESSAGRQESLVISPRLMAKFLTQSYPFLTPQSVASADKNAIHLGAVNRTYSYLNMDPDFQALNSNYLQLPYNPAIVLPGPSGADAIRQIWRWVLADDDAVAFLNGEPDEWGMTVNPYYLPKGNPAAVVPWYLDEQKNYIDPPVQRAVGMANLDGTPQKLSDLALDSFPRNDETLMPLQLNGERSRFDSIQFAPYAETFLLAARQAFRADPKSKTFWNPNVVNAIGEKGDWTSSGAQLPGQKFMLAITDSVSAQRWGLNTATIVSPNSTSTTRADTKGMTNALGAMVATSLDNVKQVDPAQVPLDGYPMTIVTYAAVNLSKSSAAERDVLAKMLEQVTTTGQESGAGLGQLPAGYVPLTSTLADEAAASILQIKTYVQASPSPSPTPTPTASPTPKPSNSNYARDDYEASSTGTGTSGSNGGTGGAATNPTVTQNADALSAERTSVSEASPIARSGLVIALVLGLAGLVIAPILFRGRGFL